MRCLLIIQIKRNILFDIGLGITDYQYYYFQSLQLKTCFNCIFSFLVSPIIFTNANNKQ